MPSMYLSSFYVIILCNATPSAIPVLFRDTFALSQSLPGSTQQEAQRRKERNACG